MNKDITKSATSLIGSLIGLRLAKNSKEPTARITSMLICGFLGGVIGEQIRKTNK